MKLKLTMIASLAFVLALGGAVRAETTIVLKGVHLCCGNCVGKVGATLKGVDGVEGKCDQKAKTVTITAKDDEAAKKALAALAAAGFHGESDNKDIKIKDDSGAEKGKVKSLTLTGIHNCCGMCPGGITAAIKKVDGVKDNTVEAKKDTFEVTGDFDALELVKALNAAGFHVKVKK